MHNAVQPQSGNGGRRRGTKGCALPPDILVEVAWSEGRNKPLGPRLDPPASNKQAPPA